MNKNEASGMWVWDFGEGKKIKVPCVVDMERMSIEPLCRIEVDNMGWSEREYFEPNDESRQEYQLEEEIKICLECREYLMKTVIVDTDDSNMEEVLECPGEDCDNKA